MSKDGLSHKVAPGRDNSGVGLPTMTTAEWFPRSTCWTNASVVGLPSYVFNTQQCTHREDSSTWRLYVVHKKITHWGLKTCRA